MAAAALAGVAAPANAQAQPGLAAAQPQQQSPIDQLAALRLVWSSLAALHHANETGNYSVLRELASPAFQASNSAAALAAVFQELRAQRVDLSHALLATPVYEIAPAIIEGGLLRMRGNFPIRPHLIRFDLLFQNVSGQWRLFGISVPPPLAVGQVQPAQQSPARPQSPGR